MVHVIDLDSIPPEHTVYDANFIVQELHRLGRANDLDAKNHWEELLILNGVHESVGAVIASLPAGSDNLKIPSNFANVLVPREVHEIVVDIWEKAMAMSEEVHRLQQQQQKADEEGLSSSASSATITPVPAQHRFATTASHDWAETDSGYYTPSAYSSSPSSTAGSETAPSLAHSRSFSGSTASTLFTRRTYSVSSSAMSGEGEGAGADDDNGTDTPPAPSSPASSASPANSAAKISEPAPSAATTSNSPQQQQQQQQEPFPPQTPSTTSTLFETLLSRLYTDMHLRRGYVDSLKLMELVIAMCTDFSSSSSSSSSSTIPSHNPTARRQTESRPRNPSSNIAPSTIKSLPKLNAATPPWRQQQQTNNNNNKKFVAAADLVEEEARKRKDSLWTNASSTSSPVQARGSRVNWRSVAEEES
ncbi:hypothetical protein BST61_g1726 [Cercospora zeina]